MHGLGWGRKQENTRGMHSQCTRSVFERQKHSIKIWRMGMIEIFAGKKVKIAPKTKLAVNTVKLSKLERARLSKTDGPKSHVCYGIYTRSVGRPAGRESKKHPLPTTHSLRECKKKHLISHRIVGSSHNMMVSYHLHQKIHQFICACTRRPDAVEWYFWPFFS